MFKYIPLRVKDGGALLKININSLMILPQDKLYIMIYFLSIKTIFVTIVGCEICIDGHLPFRRWYYNVIEYKMQ